MTTPLIERVSMIGGSPRISELVDELERLVRNLPRRRRNARSDFSRSSPYWP
jgi:hypothetical protein